MPFKVYIFIILYNLIFPIRLNAVPFFEYFILLTLFIPIISKKINMKMIINIFEYKLFIFLSMFLTVLAGISFLLNASTETIAIYQGIKYFIMITIIFIIVELAANEFKEELELKLMKMIVLSGFIVSISCIFEFIFPEFKILINKIIDTSGNINYEDSFRVHGLASSGGASLSVSISLIGILSFILFKLEKSYMWFFISIFLFFSTIIIGRTGILISVLFLILSNLQLKNLPIFIIVVLSFGFFWNNYLIDSEYYNIIYGYSFELVKNYIESGNFESNSLSHLNTMYFLPEWNHFLYGGGYWRYPTHEYLLSDVGYIKMLMGYGIFGFLVFYIFNFYIFFKAFMYYGYFFNHKLYFYFLFFILFIVEIKESFLIQNYSIRVMLILIIIYILKIQKTKIKRVYNA